MCPRTVGYLGAVCAYTATSILCCKQEAEPVRCEPEVVSRVTEGSTTPIACFLHSKAAGRLECSPDSPLQQAELQNHQNKTEGASSIARAYYYLLEVDERATGPPLHNWLVLLLFMLIWMLHVIYCLAFIVSHLVW